MSEENLNWNCEMEVNLFHALRGHKPVGVNRHFHMVSIHEKLSSTYKKITAKQIWDYLSELYDLNALNESEILPFPNKELEFHLPDTDFSEVREKSFPRLNLPKQDADKLEGKTEKSEKTDKLEKQDKTDKIEKQHEKQDKQHEKQDKQHEKQDKQHDKQDKHHEKQDKIEKQHDKRDKQHEKQDKHEKGSSKSSKTEGRHSTGTPVLNTPDNSPKRKRTRHTPSSTASPATPDAPPPKRRR